MDETTDKKQLVRDGYDGMAESYLAWTLHRPTLRLQKLDQLLQSLPPKPKILELGCGAGVPVTRILTERMADVVGNDISPRQLELARQNCPTARFVLGDMAGLDLEAASFDAVVAFYSVFHLPRHEHPAMLARIHGWLRAGGGLLLNLAAGDSASITNEFFGKDMFWSSHAPETSLAMIADAGFDIVEQEVRRSEDVEDENDPDNGVRFLWVLARKR